MTVLGGGLTGKRLLLLGGGMWRSAIKDYADAEGIELVVAGNDPDTPLVEIASEYYDIDSTDADRMKHFIRDAGIDGVYTGSAEPVVRAASSYLLELGLPCYCKPWQWDALQNKAALKRLLREHGLPVSEQYPICSDGSCRVPDYAFPVIVKPVDSCGSAGTSCCHSRGDLESALQYARAASASGNAIVERFVRNDDAVGVLYTLADGKAYFSGSQSKTPVCFPDQEVYIAGLFLFESIFGDEFRERFEEPLFRLFQDMGLSEGSIWFEVFHDGSQYYFNEAGYRYGGSITVYPVNYFYGYNQVAIDMHYALTGIGDISVGGSLLPSGLNRCARYCTYPIILDSGRIGSISGVEEIEKDSRVVKVCLRKRVGQIVVDTPSFGRIGALVHFVFDDPSDCEKMIQHIRKTIRIADENGNDMAINLLDYDFSLIDERVKR